MAVLYKDTNGNINSIIPDINNIDDTTVSATSTYSSEKITEIVDSVRKDYVIYTFKIHKDDSNPKTAVTPFMSPYGCDNMYFKSAYMDYENDTFNYGDWENAFFIRDLRPCFLNYDGSIKYYLDKNDYTKKLDGTEATDVTDMSSLGNVMIGWPTVWVYAFTSANYDYVMVSDKQLDYRFHAWAHHDKNGDILDYIYIPAYAGSYDGTRLRSISGIDYHNADALTVNKIMSNTTRQQEINFAQANNTETEQGEGWYILHKAEWDLRNFLLVLISMSTNSREAFGNGNISSYVSTSNTGILQTGTLNDKGLFYGKSDSVHAVKVFGSEGFTWGDIWKSLAGWNLVNGVQKIKLTHGQEDGSTVTGFNTTADGYVSIADSTPSGTNGGYISGWKFIDYGLAPLVASGSSTTYLCNGLWFSNNANCFALFGGDSGDSVRCGAFCCYLGNSAAGVGWNVGAALSYKPLAR